MQINILIVDDDRDIRMLLENYLKKLEIERIHFTDTAKTTYDFLNINDLKSEPVVELIILDIILRKDNGIEICKKIKKHPAYKEVPVIMITAQKESEYLTEAFEAGAMDYLKKPIKKIEFMASPFDNESIDFLAQIDAFPLKIPSGEIVNYPYLEKIGRLNKDVILSTGMSTLGEIEDALNLLTFSGTDISKITVLHCNTEYPTPFEDVNLKAMLTIKNAFPGIKSGYSDHTLGIEIPIAAAALGAEVIEKHFTLDVNMEGPDHKASLTPDSLKEMVKAIRNIEKAMGSGIKKPSESEQKNIKIVRKSIVASKDIKKDEIFTSENITLKRPGNGLSPVLWSMITGKASSKNYKKDEQIQI